MKTLTKLKGLALASLMAVGLPAHSADIFVINFDGPGVGFNDPTLVDPVGGNPATTLGEQRFNVFLVAAFLWGQQIESDVPIFLGALFSPLECSPTGGVLGSAGPTSVFRDNPLFPEAETWYVGALADSLAGEDLNPGFIDLIAEFNGDIGVNPDCLTGQSWYNGFDNNNDPTSEIDLLSVVMHEFAHGLGFLELFGLSGTPFFGFFDAYSRNLFDNTLGLRWDEMTNEERSFSTTNSGNLVWNGPAVTAAAPDLLGPRPSVEVLDSSSGLAGVYEAQSADFGRALRQNGGLTGKMVVTEDEGGDSAGDGCEPITNNVRGKIALIDRGSCNFTVKVLNAQNAGAKGVIVVNNVASGLPSMGGFDAAVRIPSVGVTQADGEAFKAAAADNVVGRLYIDAAFQAGADPDGFVRLYAPGLYAPGSSTSHWDTTATPNLLMEPFISDNLEPVVTLDLTTALFEDLGWVLQ